MMQKIAIAIVCSTGIAGAVYAKELPFDFTHCYVGLAGVDIAETGEDEFSSFEIAGVIRSNHTAKLFDNATSHCIGTIETVSKDWSMLVYCKLMTPEKDWIVYRQQRQPGDETWDWVVASSGGKWQGATGTGASKRITDTQRVKEDTGANCNQHTGSLTVPD